MTTTEKQFDSIILKCIEVFSAKMKDYGSAWRILRLSSLTDQIFIKAQRIRSIENKGRQEVSDSIEAEFRGILNYSIIALIQLEKGLADSPDLSVEEASLLYLEYAKKTKIFKDFSLLGSEATMYEIKAGLFSFLHFSNANCIFDFI